MSNKPCLSTGPVHSRPYGSRSTSTDVLRSHELEEPQRDKTGHFMSDHPAGEGQDPRGFAPKMGPPRKALIGAKPLQQIFSTKRGGNDRQVFQTSPENRKAATIVKAFGIKANPEPLAAHHALVSVAAGTFAEVVSEASLSGVGACPRVNFGVQYGLPRQNKRGDKPRRQHGSSPEFRISLKQREVPR